MKIENFLLNIDLPKKYYKEDFDISEKIKEEKTNFFKMLEEVDGGEFETEQQQIIRQSIDKVLPEIENNFEYISKTLEYYEMANPKGAQEELDDLMDKLKENIFIASIDDWVTISINQKDVWTRMRITPGTQFFRVRAVDERSDGIESNPDELFHIPLSKKAYTNNERFSLAGFPSLYLASMLPLAWQECGYPPNYYYSEFQYEKLLMPNRKGEKIREELKFLALYSPEEICRWGSSVKYNDFDLWVEVILRYLKQYPLVLACSFVNHSGKVTYKQEYVIPQMLMQWVQRNSGFVQGISYFTCIDIKMYPSRWCAYNIVIPAQSPFDTEKYSLKLREDFCWGKPKFFIVPITDKNENKADREVLYKFIEKISSAFREYYFVDEFRKYLQNIEHMCVTLYHIMLNGQTTDMQLIIHTLDLVNRFYSQVSKTDADKIIEEVKGKNLPDYQKSDLEQSSTIFKELFKEFTDRSDSKSSVSVIIDKYRNTLWNSFHCGSIIQIFCKGTDKVEEEIKWLHDNHLVHCIRFLHEDEKTISDLKEICDKTGLALSQLWDMPIGDDEWMKKHINEIKTPFFVRANDSSLYFPDGPDTYDYIYIGFDKTSLGRDLI